MTNDLIKAIIDAIKLGALAEDSPLTLLEFEAIHAATLQTVAIAKRKLVIELVANVRQDFKGQVEALAARI